MKAALEGLGPALGVIESLIVVVESEAVDRTESCGPAGLTTSHTPEGILASWVLSCSMASATGPAVVARTGSASCMPGGALASLVCLHKVEGMRGTQGINMATSG